jgi:hypothetical protein
MLTQQRVVVVSQVIAGHCPANGTSRDTANVATSINSSSSIELMQVQRWCRDAEEVQRGLLLGVVSGAEVQRCRTIRCI